MSDCVFCRLLEANSMMKVCEDDLTAAFMDIAGDVDGHILVIPKKHVKNILDCDAETLCSLITSVKKVADHLTRNCGYDGINLLNASGESAGQSVPHFHIHLIPRKKGDGIDAWPAFTGARQDIETLFTKIKM